MAIIVILLGVAGIVIVSVIRKGSYYEVSKILSDTQFFVVFDMGRLRPLSTLNFGE